MDTRPGRLPRGQLRPLPGLQRRRLQFETPPQVQLTFFVNFQNNRVVYAEAGKDLVDVLFSFLTLPLGNIVKLAGKESINNIHAAAVRVGSLKVGSLSSLHESVANIGEQYLMTPTCKEMLLKPRNSMAHYCKKLKVNIDNTDPLHYFICKSWDCNRRESGSPITTFKNQKCSCGEVMDKEVFPKCLDLENGFVKNMATFIISDDLSVKPNSFETTACLLQKLGYQNSLLIQPHTCFLTNEEVILLLKISLVSATPLTDLFFQKVLYPWNFRRFLPREFPLANLVSVDDGRQMDLKLMVHKSTGTIVFAEAEEGFVDFLFSFLTFPLGGVFHMFEGGGYNSSNRLWSLNKLYESIKELSSERYLISQDLKDKLIKPQIAPQFELSNQILPICASTLPVYYCHTHFYRELCYDITEHVVVPRLSDTYVVPKCVPVNFVDPKSSNSAAGEFARGPTMYMVSDNLQVTPMLSGHVMWYLRTLNVSLKDLEQKVIKIGVKEGLAILKASLISSTALTTGLSQFIRNS